MRKTFLLSIIILLATLSACTRIGPGHAGIKVEQSGSDRGVLTKTATTGWVWYNPVTEQVIEYQTSMRNVKWTRDPHEGRKDVNEEITFTNKDSMVVATDIGVGFSLDPSKVPVFYVKFLAKDEDDLDLKFTNGYLRNVVRNCMNDFAGKYAIYEIMGDNAQFLKDSELCIKTDVARYGVTIDQFGLLSAPRPPESVTNAINEKAKAEQIAQQKKTELVQVQADAAKRVAEAEGGAKAQVAQAQGEAEGNRLRSTSINENILKMRELDNQHDLIWRLQPGMLPSTLVINGKSGAAGLLFNLKATKE